MPKNADAGEGHRGRNALSSTPIRLDAPNVASKWRAADFSRFAIGRDADGMRESLSRDRYYNENR